MVSPSLFGESVILQKLCMRNFNGQQKLFVVLLGKAFGVFQPVLPHLVRVGLFQPAFRSISTSSSSTCEGWPISASYSLFQLSLP